MPEPVLQCVLSANSFVAQSHNFALNHSELYSAWDNEVKSGYLAYHIIVNYLWHDIVLLDSDAGVLHVLLE